jgi:hypothetical protein
MRFLALWRPAGVEPSGPPDPAHMAEMGKLVDEMMQKGSLIGTEPLAARSSGARVKRSGANYSVSEEPDRMAGYAFLNAASREEAIEQVKVFMQVAGDGVCEIRQIVEM